ncbi:DNA-binding MarR family transcriptional regulator [Deinococcus metalli]|jgi:DNA-binding MarR family transcriptional regulator|uniref:MarR family transcriptional regulator n=1 Tax=Deinococcus metalli TaxID=1141878 RepID=A0A7W8NT07_9DEIO|nr:MarR family transcriptional regulator [Deinococcus metalli]MBB5377707.1 DNA-binding MarR family transcriptional regulator [Deinococcus metalli]GHF52719.1 MarR family transcriptional regulator [Deinococcus metalli]
MTDSSPPTRPPAVRLWVDLDRVYTVLSRRVTARMADFDLTTPQFRVLRQLSGQPRSPGDVAERIGVTPGNLTGIIDRLEHDGLVRRERGEEDRRSLTLHLTPAGEEVLGRVVPQMHAHLQGLFSALSPDEITQTLSVLDKLERHLNAKEAVNA